MLLAGGKALHRAVDYRIKAIETSPAERPDRASLEV